MGHAAPKRTPERPPSFARAVALQRGYDEWEAEPPERVNVGAFWPFTTGDEHWPWLDSWREALLHVWPWAVAALLIGMTIGDVTSGRWTTLPILLTWLVLVLGWRRRPRSRSLSLLARFTDADGYVDWDGFEQELDYRMGLRKRSGKAAPVRPPASPYNHDGPYNSHGGPSAANPMATVEDRS